MAVITDLDDFVSYINTLFNSSSTPPAEGEEDYIVWTALANVAINTWENEEGILWNELFISLEDAADGDKLTDGTNSYDLPTLFSFPASGFVWVGSTPFSVIRLEDLQILEKDMGNWCYFIGSKLKFNPNLTMSTGEKIEYTFYKKATELSEGDDEFEMKDPMFAVYFALAELKKEEGNSGELQMASQKLTAMKTRNEMPTWYQPDQLIDNVTQDGFGV